MQDHIYVLGAVRTRTAILTASLMDQQMLIVGLFGFCKCSMFKFQELCYMNVRMVNARFKSSMSKQAALLAYFLNWREAKSCVVLMALDAAVIACICIYIYTILKLRSESWKEHSPFSSKNQEGLSTDDSIHARALGCDVLESKRTE